MYEMCVIPRMDYAAEVWGYNITIRPNMVQNNAICSFFVSSDTLQMLLYKGGGMDPTQCKKKIAYAQVIELVINHQSTYTGN